jgi:membrane protein implicated in regulation of membrane protease activity
MLKAFFIALGAVVGVLIVLALSAPTVATGYTPTWLQVNMPLIIIGGIFVVVLFVVLYMVRSSNQTIQQISYHNAQTTQQAFRTVEALSRGQQEVLIKALVEGWRLKGYEMLPPPGVDEQPLKLQVVEAEYVKQIS